MSEDGHMVGRNMLQYVYV